MTLVTRSIRYLLLFCLLVTSCVPAGTATPSGTASSSVTALPVATNTVAPPEPTRSATPSPAAVAGEFASDGELDQGWYWLNESDQAATRWKLSPIKCDEGVQVSKSVPWGR